ncbi:MAG: undecaprenyl-diphosphate phosphatase [Ectothiorhodospiraceae bacterium]
MPLFQVVVLAILQGITEFLPISSSGHLLLVPQVTDWGDQGLGFDLAVHLGTLLAVVTYFRSDLMRLTRDWGRSLRVRAPCGESPLAWAIIIGTIPVGLAGLAAKDVIESAMRAPEVAAVVITLTTVGFGVLLGVADWFAPQRRTLHRLGWRDAVFVGCAQAIALIPGTSRSGITMTAGRMLGLRRDAAARFSFLLAIPVTVLASGLTMIDLARTGAAVPWGNFLLGGGLAALVAFVCIHFFLKWINQWGMLPFVAYRLVLGVVLVILLW